MDLPSAQIEWLPMVEGFTLQVTPQVSLSLAPALEAQIETLWEKASLNRTQPLFNGQLFSAQSVTPHGMTGQWIPYKHYVASRLDSTVAHQLQLKPVGVSGVLRWKDEVLWAIRSPEVTAFRGFWELVPSGGISPEVSQPDGQVNYTEQLLLELTEETGIPAHQIQHIQPLGIALDPTSDVYDLCLSLQLDEKLPQPTLADLTAWMSPRGEYVHPQWVGLANAKDFFQGQFSQMVPVSYWLLEFIRLNPE